MKKLFKLMSEKHINRIFIDIQKIVHKIEDEKIYPPETDLKVKIDLAMKIKGVQRGEIQSARNILWFVLTITGIILKIMGVI